MEKQVSNAHRSNISTPQTAVDISEEGESSKSPKNNSIDFMIESLATNSKFMLSMLKDQKEKIQKEADYLVQAMKESEEAYKKMIDASLSTYLGMKQKFDKVLNAQMKPNLSSVFELAQTSSDTKTVFDCIKFFCEKTELLDSLKENESFANIQKRLGKGNYKGNTEEITKPEEQIVKQETVKRRKGIRRLISTLSTRLQKQEKDEEDSQRNSTISSASSRIKTPHNPLMKEILAYYEKNKPPYSIFVKARRRIFINYYHESGKRTTKSYSLSNIKSLKEFKELLERVKRFINTHKIRKGS